MPSGMMTANEMTDMELPNEAMTHMAVPNEVMTDMELPNEEVMTDMAVLDEVMTDMAVLEELIRGGGVMTLTCAPLAQGTEGITVQITIAVHVTLDMTVAMEQHMVGVEALSMIVTTEAEALPMVVTS